MVPKGSKLHILLKIALTSLLSCLVVFMSQTSVLICKSGLSIGVIAHALRNRKLGNIPPSFDSSKFWLPQWVLVQLFHNPVELFFREGRIVKIREHVSLVWGYIFLVPGKCSMTLKMKHFKYEKLEIVTLADLVWYNAFYFSIFISCFQN